MHDYYYNTHSRLKDLQDLIWITQCTITTKGQLEYLKELILKLHLNYRMYYYYTWTPLPLAILILF